MRTHSGYPRRGNCSFSAAGNPSSISPPLPRTNPTIVPADRRQASRGFDIDGRTCSDHRPADKQQRAFHLEHAWSTHALFVAGMATALAGFRTIGESTPGVVIALMLILLTFPAVWADAFSAGIRWTWRFARTRGGISAFLVVAGMLGIVINQWRDENYIRNWILIPMGITAAFVIGVGVLFQLIELSCRYGPPVFASIRTRAVAAFRRKSCRRSRDGR